MAIFDTCFLIPGIKTADCAAWVQAVFSIVAIAFSTGLILWQHRHQAQKEQQARYNQRLERLATVLQLCRYSREVTQGIKERVSHSSSVAVRDLDRDLAQLGAIVTALTKYEAKDFAEYKFLKPFMGVLAMTNASKSHVEDARAMARTHGAANSKHLADDLSHLPASLAELEGELSALIDETGKRSHT